MSSCPGSCRGSWGAGFLQLRSGAPERLVVVVGHRWPLLSGLGRPRDGRKAEPSDGASFCSIALQGWVTAVIQAAAG
jgi:hypothetical protein